MELVVTGILKALLLPPGGNILLALLGIVMLWRAAMLGRVLVLASVITLYLFSTPGFARLMAGTLEVHEPVTAETKLGDFWQAIVVLGGGTRALAPEYGSEVPRARTLERLRFAANLHKRTRLPVLVSGGIVFDDRRKSEAQVMSDVLKNDFGIEVRWAEGESRTTGENAIYSRSILSADNIDNILLVTHAIHMRRAELAFGKQGFAVKPAPTAYVVHGDGGGWSEWLPNAGALGVSRDALHEHIGFVWYLFRG